MNLFPRYESPSPAARAVMAALDAASLLLAPRQPRPTLPLSPERLETLLLLRLDGIGDNVCSWPAIRLLREALPRTRITLAVGPWTAPLYRECPWVDEVIEWDSGLFGLFRGRGLGGMKRDLAVSRLLKGKGFDAGIDLRGDILSILLLRMVAPPVRVAETARGGSRLLTDPMAKTDGTATRRTYAVARAALGLPPEPAPRVQDWPRPLALERAVERLKSAGWKPEVQTVALAPLALWPWRQWPGERFREAANRLKTEMGLQVVWFLEQADQAAEFATDDPVFLGPLDEVAAALGHCRLAVANDSGLMHLAVAAGCGTVQLFGPGDAALFSHAGPGLSLLHDTSCTLYPCTQRGECARHGEGWCLEAIGVGAVVDACRRLLAEER